MVELPQRPPATLQEIWAELQRDMAIVREMVDEDLQLLVRTTIMEGKLVGNFLLEFLLGVLLATLMLHNGSALARMARDACKRLGGTRGLELGQRSVVTIRSTVLGILGSAAAQTGVAAFAYWLVGAPHWPLLAFVTFLLGLLQVGPVLIWAPLAVWLWLGGQTGMAVFLALWGTFAVGLTDNLVKTLVVSRGADLPAILVFLGAIGGLLGWGVVGIFVGPVILAVCMELALSWLDRDAGERDVMAQGAANADGDA
jgi:predicted PurR-regulated permease PerM